MAFRNRSFIENPRAPFFVWKAYQRRVDAFATSLNLYPLYLHFDWEEKSRLHKILSYAYKLYKTLYVLFQKKPKLFYIQAPPTVLVYVAYLVSKVIHAKYIADCHNTMIYDSFWARLPFASYVLRQAHVAIVHNDHVAELAKRRAIPSVVLMDRPPDVERIDWPVPEIAVKRRGRPRVIVPCSYDNDEPLDELQKATFMLPGMDFYFTWYKEKLPERFLAAFKDNAIFLGFLPLPQFNALLAHGDVILVLTSRLGTQPSGASEALAFEKPLVVSDLKIIRSLFPTGCIYVKNNASDIARGVECALDSKERLAYEMRLFKIRKLRSWEAQFEVFNNRMRRAVGSGQRCGMQESSVSR